MNVREIITQRIIEKMDQGIIPWKSPYLLQGFHQNLKTGHIYTGVNILSTWLSGYSTPYWASWKQITELGGHVKKGEKATPIVFFKIMEHERESGDVDRFPMIKYFNNWNADQCVFPEGVVPSPEEREVKRIEDCDKVAEHYIDGSGVHFEEGDFGFASYSVSKDLIKCPRPELITSEEEYYSTLFHEIVHSTRHERRLGRVKDNVAYEELVAEIGSAFLCAETGIEFREDSALFKNQVAYIQGWKKRMREDPNLIISAASKATKAVEYVLQYVKEEKCEIAVA